MQSVQGRLRLRATRLFSMDRGDVAVSKAAVAPYKHLTVRRAAENRLCCFCNHIVIMEYGAGPEPPYFAHKLDPRYDAIIARRYLNNKGNKVPKKQSPLEIVARAIALRAELGEGMLEWFAPQGCNAQGVVSPPVLRPLAPLQVLRNHYSSSPPTATYLHSSKVCITASSSCSPME